MSAASVPSNLEVVSAGEPSLFDSLARLVPDHLQVAYLSRSRTYSNAHPRRRNAPHSRTKGILALLTRHTPNDIAEERERFQLMLDLHRQFSDDAQQKMLAYVHELESRISDLPHEVLASLDPQRIAKILGENLRQHFLQSGVRETVPALQATAGAMADAQQKLTRGLMELSDHRGGVVAQVQSANSRLLDSLECRARKLDSLVLEFKSDPLRIWMPIVIGAALLTGLFLGFALQAHRDSEPAAGTAPAVHNNAHRKRRRYLHSERNRQQGAPAQKGRDDSQCLSMNPETPTLNAITDSDCPVLIASLHFHV